MPFSHPCGTHQRWAVVRQTPNGALIESGIAAVAQLWPGTKFTYGLETPFCVRQWPAVSTSVRVTTVAEQ